MRNAIFAAALLGVAGTSSAQLINEYEPNQPGSDPSTQTIELIGTPGASFSGWLLSIESDFFGGNVDRASEINGMFDANGILAVDIPDLENPGFTTILTDSFTGTAGVSDIDQDDDGVVDDLSEIGTLLDVIGINDSIDDFNNNYATQLGGTNFAFIGSEPQLTFRDSNFGNLYSVDFNGIVYDEFGAEVPANLFTSDPTAPTFGGVNPGFIPAPASAALLGLGGLVAVRRRR